jgi:Spy/CpxP family protein refolding chaperone
MKNILFIITACLIFVFLASTAGCRHFKAMRCGPYGFSDHIETITKKISKDLDLTDEQKNHLNTIKGEITIKFLDQKKHMAEMLTAIREEIQKDSVDRNHLEKLSDSQKQFRDDMHRFMLDKFEEFHAMLTKEQRIKLNMLIEKIWNKFNEE